MENGGYMGSIEEKLKIRREELGIHIAKAERYLQRAPKGNLIVGKSKGTYQYYESKDGIRKYISKKEKTKIERLAQKEYCTQLLKEATKEKKKLDQFIANKDKVLLDFELADNVENALKPGIKELIIPYELTTEEYRKEWESQAFQPKDIKIDRRDAIFTEKGEMVRSKSEKIIADKLYAMKIPYHYEQPLNLNPYGTIYPDFTILNIAERRVYYWEHFGMMGELEYCQSALRKMEAYIMNGFYPGTHTIYTFETKEHPLNIKVVELNIQKILER